MNFTISGGSKEQGIVIGNSFDKYNSKNPIVRLIMQGFSTALSDLISKISPKTIHEIGCGEGYWVLHWNKQGYTARGCDFSQEVVKIAQENALQQQLPPSLFLTRSIYDLEPLQDSADLVVCCEVLEHLEHPDIGLKALHRVTKQDLILSVPHEPLWCALNMARGKYISHLGNTPGHLQHWSKDKFIHFVAQFFEVVEIKSPVPWTMLWCRPLQ